jgi:formylglycine-generating enzyme required for sulfatase activity
MPNHIFISYAREDQTYARALADHLRQRGFDVWMDDRIDFGDRWWQTIVAALQASAAFVVVMAPESETSEWVHREVLLALRERKPIFPLLLRGRGFSILVDRQYADVTGGRMPPDDFCDRLREVVPLHAPTQPPEPPPPQPVPPKKKSAALPREHPFEPEMILIPAGDFLMGSDPAKDKDARDNEHPQHTLPLPDYYIARTPITNAQYAAFVNAMNHKQPKHWKRGAPPTGKENPPVVYVSWYDAVAYCDWLAQLTGKPYRLPSEPEWEKAARGTDGRIYPWGDEWDPQLCNTKESGIGDTTPVGAYPQGDSPYGLLDMAGNVWEWTRTLHRDYPYDPRDGREDLEAAALRVVRGGSFHHSRESARCAVRDWDFPGSVWNSFGFRVVVSRASG